MCDVSRRAGEEREPVAHDESDKDDDGLIGLVLVFRMSQSISAQEQTSGKGSSRRRQRDPTCATEPAGDPRNPVRPFRGRENGGKMIRATGGRDHVHNLLFRSEQASASRSQLKSLPWLTRKSAFGHLTRVRGSHKRGPHVHTTGR